jgi:hypothetical protein
MSIRGGRCGRAAAALGATLAVVALLPMAAQAQPASFGVSSFAVSTSTQQAGAHADLHSDFMLDADARGGPKDELRNALIRLPPGIIGNVTAIPECSPAEFELNGCQPPSQVGVLTIIYKIGLEPSEQATEPVYNLTPTPGSSATFGASMLTAKFLMQTSLSKDGTYALEVAIRDLSSEIPVLGTSLTLWGVPAASTHDLERSRTQLGGPQPSYGPPNESGEREIVGIEPTPAGVAPVPLLTNSSDCEGPQLTSTLLVESWEGQSADSAATMPTPSGCQLLHIAPSISVVPETTERDTPSAYNIGIAYPLDEEAFGLATPSLRSATVTLPLGTSLSPSMASGLVGCTGAQFQAEECPSASKLGTATIDTPLLSRPMTGTVYVSTPTPEAMYRMMIVAAGENITVHLIGVMHPNPETGQLTVSFTETPQVPIAALDLHLFGGERAPLANPATCGEAGTAAHFVSYGGQEASAVSDFHVDADGAGGACPTPEPFTPGFLAGTLSAAAGGSSSFAVTITRQDGQQTLGALTADLPPGLTGMLANVPTCGEPAASQGACPQASAIGSVVVGAGAGASPLQLAGTVYLTGPYKGAPYGLAIVVPAIAGPFDLGTIVVRAQIKVAPTDLHLAIVTDPLPQILSGIPLRLRTMHLDLNRPGFIVNPTNCSPMSVGATIQSQQGTSISTSSPFQVSGCGSLPFEPKLEAAVPARASSRGNGAGLDVKVTAAAGGHANLESVSLSLPKPLKARLAAIQQSCVGATFAKNPAACPPHSVVGNAVVDTPVLSVPLAGPVYLVFYRGVKYPRLEMLLQGSGVEVRLTASLNVSGGISHTTLIELPDVPMNTFEMRLPAGRSSVLGATEGLCGKLRVMPFTAVGQNEARTRGTVRVAVGGCHARAAMPKLSGRAGRSRR